MHKKKENKLGQTTGKNHKLKVKTISTMKIFEGGGIYQVRHQLHSMCLCWINGVLEARGWFCEWPSWKSKLQEHSLAMTIPWLYRLAFSVKLPVPHGPPNTGWLYPFHRLGQGCIVPIPHGLAGAILYLYCTGWLRLYCTCSTQVGQGHLHMAALTIYVTCLFGNSFTYIWNVAYHIQ